MDNLTKELQSFLVILGREPQRVNHELSHAMEHIICLLPEADQEALLHYFGLFGHDQLALQDIACEQHRDEADMMDHIDHCLRQLAISPEWQQTRQKIFTL